MTWINKSLDEEDVNVHIVSERLIDSRRAREKRSAKENVKEIT